MFLYPAREDFTNYMAGILIAFEGVDGCGKGTQLRLVEDRLRRIGLGDRLVLNKIPGGTVLGDEVRRLLFEFVTTHAMEVNACSLLYLVSHLQNLVENITPALDDSKIVLSDRWDTYSGTVFGLRALRVPVHADVMRLRWSLAGVHPDLVIWMRGKPALFLDRAVSRTSEGHEAGKAWATAEKLGLLQDAYQDLFASVPGKVAPVDVQADAHPVTIFEEQVWPVVLNLLVERGYAAR